MTRRNDRPHGAAGGGADVVRALEAECIARRLAHGHPDPDARRVYDWIADRAAGRALQLERPSEGVGAD